MSAPVLTPRLGCASTYTCQIHYWDRSINKLRYYTTLSGIMELTWERALDDYGEARVRFRPGKGDECCGKLKPLIDVHGNLIEPGVWPWAHELAIYRESELVWAGPIFSVDELVLSDGVTDHIQIVARDFLAWLDRRVIHEDIFMNDQEYDLVHLAERVVRDAFEPDDPGVLEHLVVGPLSGKMSTNTIRHWESKSSEELRQVARQGVDFTCVGRAIILRRASHDPAVPTITLRSRDFLAGVEIRTVGAEAATVGVAVGQAPQPEEGDETPPENIPPVKVYWPETGGLHPFFGLIENWTQNESVLNETFLLWVAKARVSEGNPPPTTLSIPADSSLSPDAPVSIHHLVPSTYFTILVSGTCRSLSQYMRLSRVHVTWSAESTSEQVAVTFIPQGVVEDEEEGGEEE